MWSWKAADPVGDALQLAAEKFLALRSKNFVLRHDPRLDPLETAFFQVACSQQIAAIEKLLGGKFKPWWCYRPRLEVFLFRSDDDVSRVYGGSAAGFASAEKWRIAVNLQSDWLPLLRHELAHVLTGHWNPYAPTLLLEGVAVWAAKSMDGVPVDAYARQLLPKGDVIPILLGPRPKKACEVSRYYALAGSFTKALIESFGLRRYERFYRDRWVNEERFAERHRQHFRLSFDAMVEIWIHRLGAGSARMVAPRFV